MKKTTTFRGLAIFKLELLKEVLVLLAAAARWTTMPPLLPPLLLLLALSTTGRVSAQQPVSPHPFPVPGCIVTDYAFEDGADISVTTAASSTACLQQCSGTCKITTWFPNLNCHLKSSFGPSGGGLVPSAGAIARTKICCKREKGSADPRKIEYLDVYFEKLKKKNFARLVILLVLLLLVLGVAFCIKSTSQESLLKPYGLRPPGLRAFRVEQRTQWFFLISMFLSPPLVSAWEQSCRPDFFQFFLTW